MKRIPLISYFSANLISLIGNNLTLIAVPWFVLETTGSAFQTGLVAFFTALPAILAAFFGGTMVDRLGQKRISIISDLASGVTVLFIPLLYGTTGLQFWQLLLLVFLSALLDGPGDTARRALLPELAEAASLPLEKANAVQQAIQRAGTLIGPAMAGFLIVWLGSSNVLWIDAATFAVSAGLFALAIPSGQPRIQPNSGYIRLLLLSFTPPFYLALAALFCGGLAAGQLNPLIMTLVQERTPAALRGRVFGIITALGLIAAPLGMVVAGFLTEWLGVIVVLLIIALIYLLVTLAQVFNSAWSEMNRVVATDKLSEMETILH